MRKFALIILCIMLMCCVLSACRFNNGNVTTGTNSSTTQSSSTGNTANDIIDDMPGDQGSGDRIRPSRNLPGMMN